MALLRGTVVAFDAGTHTATIRPDGGPPQTLTTVKTSRDIAAADMAANRKVIFDTGDHGDAGDIVVIAVYV